MPNYRVSASKVMVHSLLKSALLLSAISLAISTSATQAATNIHVDNNINLVSSINQPIDYYSNSTKVKTLHPKYQSTQQHTISYMLTQLRAYQQVGVTKTQQYLAYKAQAWLNYACHEDNVKSSTNAGTQALQAGADILQVLQNGSEKQFNIITNIPPTSTLMRPDLWAILSALKDKGGIVNAPRELAFSEVALIWAAANQCEHGWHQAGTHFRMADRWLEQAREAYINAHNSQTNVALEELTNHYFKKFASLDSTDNNCQGLALPLK